MFQERERPTMGGAGSLEQVPAMPGPGGSVSTPLLDAVREQIDRVLSGKKFLARTQLTSGE